MEKVGFWLNPIFYCYCKRAATGSFELLSAVSFLVSKSGGFMQKEQTAFPLISIHYFGDFLLLCIYGKVSCEGLTEAPAGFEVHSLNTLQKRFL